MPQPGDMIVGVGVDPEEVEVDDGLSDPEPEESEEESPEFEPPPLLARPAGKAMTRTMATSATVIIARRVRGLFHNLDRSEGFPVVPVAPEAPAALSSSSDSIWKLAMLKGSVSIGN